MFADSLLDSAWPSRSRLGWSTLSSFAIQAAIVASFVVVPLIYTAVLPQLPWAERPIAMPSSAPSAPFRGRSASAPGGHARTSELITPLSIPQTIEPGTTTAIADAPIIDQLGSRTSDGSNGGNGVDHGIETGFDAVAPPPPPPVTTHPPRVSRMMEGNLIYRPQPAYPLAARLARIQGAVILRAVISKQGTIEDLQLVSGNPLLVRAALDAVQQWRYRPYLLNGDPVEVDTQITVNFVLGGG